jgi:Sugar transferases involved in lipopolysaccharide synthesis
MQELELNRLDAEMKETLFDNIDEILLAKKVQFALKRIIDFLSSFIGLLLLLPILLIICLSIKIDSKGSIVFKQTRVGINGKEYKILKFRTMVADAEKKGMQITVGNDSRITKIGHFLRKTKLDELPQLVNVLIGDMSLVGPRPETPKYVAMYDEKQRNVLKVRPGITDIASIYFRSENSILANEIEPEKVYIEKIMPYKLELNSQYLIKLNILYDFKIIFLTIYAIISGKAPIGFQNDSNVKLV